MSAGHLLVAYHGCDIVVRDTLVAGKLAALRHSRNKYDWLGPGSYFFEGDSERALKFAQASSAYPERMYTRNPILRPLVVGAVLCVQNWLDMTTQRGIREFVDAHDAMVATLQASRKPLPENRPAGPGDDEILLRRLDNAVFCYLHAARATVCRHLPYQAVRGAFSQGKTVAKNSGFRRDTHIQLALLDNRCVVGWFLPEGSAPLLDEEQFPLARAEFERACGDSAARKRRSRQGPLQ